MINVTLTITNKDCTEDVQAILQNLLEAVTVILEFYLVMCSFIFLVHFMYT